MKTFLPAILVFFVCTYVNAQNCADVHFCNKDMTLSPHTFASKIIKYGRQSGMPSTFSDVRYKHACGDNIPPNTTCGCNPNDLFYKVFYPTDIDYDTCALAAVIMFHGGGFTDCSGVNNAPPPDPEQTGDDVITICQEFARKGFVAFDVEYRRGNYTDSDYVTAQSLLSTYRALQDAQGAIRCIIERQNYQNTHTQTDDYKIDVNTIFLGGNSAGSIIALTCAYYYRQSKIDSILPGVASILNSSINPNYYDPDINNSSYSYDATLDYRPYIKGILNNWGIATIHKAYVNNPGTFFLSNDGYKPPIISFHGLEDNYLPPGLAPQFYAPEGENFRDIPGLSIHTETNCLGDCPSMGTSYSLNPDPSGNADAYSIGSERIYSVLSTNSIATLLYRDCQMKHGLDANCSATDCYKSEFGTGIIDRESTYKYIAARAANFFQVVLIYGPGVNYTGAIKFTECEDKRHLCQRGNTNGCKNSDVCDSLDDE